MSKEHMEKECEILHEQLIRLHEEFKKETTTTMEKVEISKVAVELYKVTKHSIYG